MNKLILGVVALMSVSSAYAWEDCRTENAAGEVFTAGAPGFGDEAKAKACEFAANACNESADTAADKANSDSCECRAEVPTFKCDPQYACDKEGRCHPVPPPYFHPAPFPPHPHPVPPPRPIIVVDPYEPPPVIIAH